jgi:hypothetical protein
MRRASLRTPWILIVALPARGAAPAGLVGPQGWVALLTPRGKGVLTKRGGLPKAIHSQGTVVPGIGPLPPICPICPVGRFPGIPVILGKEFVLQGAKGVLEALKGAPLIALFTQ